MGWGKKKQYPVVNTLVGLDTKVQGDVQFAGGCHIDGYVKGNVRSLEEEDSMLSVAEGGCIEGNVRVGTLLLSGTVKGDVSATERVELASTARVVGNVRYNLLEMAIGAEVNGKLIHQSETQAPEPTVKIEAVKPIKAAGERG